MHASLVESGDCRIVGGVRLLHALALFSFALTGCASPAVPAPPTASAPEMARLSVRFVDVLAGAPLPCRWILRGAGATLGNPEPRVEGIGASLETWVGAGEWSLEIDPLDAGASPRRIAFELEAGEERYEEIEVEWEDPGAAGP